MQSSSTIGYLDAESAHMPNMQGLSQPKFRRTSNLSNTDKEKSEDIVNSDMKLIRPPSEGISLCVACGLCSCSHICLRMGHLIQYSLQKG